MRMRYKNYDVHIHYSILAANIIGMMICDQFKMVATITIEQLMNSKTKKLVLNILLDKMVEGEENSMVFVEDIL
jgi:hypothetical protein